ncbi:MAG: hypothetical protein OEU09_00465 [Rhodospirillales bacterium]|nr:hypothetical protein [Rhodospirillales bacterium]MDH3792756.1 hypothetical protein [Rhodospirillales bacterium]MDH3909734.1 hypothetical protein [Rhodospirillales bacterium]MDH3919673.1 hypothetical protein [Rhodospirillales bacterium]MDH3965540.1 hypothetical protein [Rhodospirillales bacterium]
MHRFLPAGAAAATGILVGATIVATRFVLDQTEPASLALLLSEPVSVLFLIGLACVALGLWLAHRQPR